ncbi:hypothetical protein Mycch_1694 [Mycolicibacterium chubuense NBB4]|uniref:Uncharacterized protein n=1 Tax=Mycolicibacterium chubuense (strain NBB4) TaxID=710421 RepID=I4BGS8_MYCCN|nr:hypothetical protein [Mycolicibacterium chubuense]AFM16485.1 hypothetical protein Mycch_1694 [Mycolicibacterium chubuense NBB4]
MSATTFFPGYAVAGNHYEATPARRTSHRAVLLMWLLPVIVVGAVLAFISARTTAPSVRYVCPPDCGRPPTGTPVAINPRFTAPDGSFSVSYPASGAAYQITTQSDGVTADFVGGEGGTLRLFSLPAAGRAPRQIAADLLADHIPDARTAYEIPNTMVGYQPGYGEVIDYWPQGSSSSFTRMRVIVMVAVKNDLALVASAAGPYHQFGPDFGPGKPSGANVQLALDMGKYVNSFSWRGDPPR